MELTEMRVGQRVRWRTAYGARTGQVYTVKRPAGLVTVDYFASVHGGWVRQDFLPGDLEAVKADEPSPAARQWAEGIVNRTEQKTGRALAYSQRCALIEEMASSIMAVCEGARDATVQTRNEEPKG